jgi:hypothetical protein
VIQYLLQGSKKHWNQQVLTTTLNVLRTYMDLDTTLFEQHSQQIAKDEDKKIARSKVKENYWARLDQKYEGKGNKPI